MITTYSQALDYIYSFVDYSLTRNLRYSPEKFNLSRMEDFLGLIGNPHQDYKVIHVAGTKGKGSTCAMITSILTKNGLKVGFYSSPHMIDFTERIRIGDVQISNQQIVNYINMMDTAIRKVPELTTFEIITGLAFKYFADSHVDFAVVEVGMGGRFDATNVVHPEVTAITSISFDHTKVLGKTLKKIAFEKAGIIKNGIPVIVTKQKTSALEIIKKIAKERNSRLVYVPNTYQAKSIMYSLYGQEFTILKNGKKIMEASIPLLGDHQLDNALTAYGCIEELKDQGIAINEAAIRSGFREIKWPGRFEIINKNPLIIIDSAHNVDSVKKLRDTVLKYLEGKQIILIFGVSEDKDAAKMLKILQPLVKTMIITKS
ncbi:MAG: bifunctional folylpolyglutamate synthase/dihydrofolate synthase, partial [Anaerolineaceae bacterium]|nr:bifunctional folylpolyglutamate synthase/dihydrofolate synthase [Anaerolineaceae bacterium]